jgi:hypothetical protein
MTLILMLAAALAVAVPQQNPRPSPRITIPEGTPVVVDGVIAPDEWSDAGTVTIDARADSTITVHFKHDGANLLFAFTGFAQPIRHVPEVMLDVTNGKEIVWGPNHWWFHASATDCWTVGRYNDFDTCVPEAPTWEASNASHSRERFEMSIPFSTVGMTLDTTPVIGIAFDVMGQGHWDLWPHLAQLGIPRSWGEAVLATGGSS